MCFVRCWQLSTKALGILAGAMEEMTAEIFRETKLCSSTASFQWNTRQPVLRLPPELLGMCISYLPLGGRLAASHVSQAWRTAAVGNPFLWADIRTSCGDARPSAWLLQLSISRARAVAIRFDVPALVQGVAEVLKAYAHLMQFINAQTNLDDYSLVKPCPLLHTLQLAGDLIITNTFLGNTVGKLATLHTEGLRLLRPARALGTLTTVSARTCTTDSLHRLFASCPALQSVSITDLKPDDEERSWHPPRSLTYIVFETNSVNLDIRPLFIACDAAAALLHAHLQPGPLVDQPMMALAVKNALSLDVRLGVNDTVTVVAELAGERYHTLVLPTLIRRYRARGLLRTFPPIFETEAVAFRMLRSIALPLAALATFVADAPALPALEVLHIRIAERQITHPPEGRSDATWELLAPLAAVGACDVLLDVPRLAQLDAQHAQVIVAALAPVASHLRVSVRGFAPGIISVPPDLKVQFV